MTQAFAFCADFQAGGDLERWMAAHRVASTASSVNWVGRTAVQAREEARLRELLRDALPQVTAREPQAMLQALRAAVGPQLSLTLIPPTPVAWRNANRFHLFAPIVVAAALVCSPSRVTIPVAVIGLTLALTALRRRELTDPIVENPYDPAWVARLRLFEDHDVTNQYTAMGSIKPGRFRLGLELVILHVIDWAARHIFTRGGLGRIGTIHFAHWVLIDDRRRAFFCSNYDGGHEAYMDDFINKPTRTNLSFSSAIAYPQTDWLIKKGALREMDFKHFQRRHQIPTDVWYKAYPGLTTRDLARDTRIRGTGREARDRATTRSARLACGDLRSPMFRRDVTADIQAFAYTGFGSFSGAASLLLRVVDTPSARGLLAEFDHLVEDLEQREGSPRAPSMRDHRRGLRALGVEEVRGPAIRSEFVEVMAGNPDQLAAALGASAPMHRQVDMGCRRSRAGALLMLYAHPEAHRQTSCADARAANGGSVPSRRSDDGHRADVEPSVSPMRSGQPTGSTGT